MEPGDRVRDIFKVAKPGDECTTGEVITCDANEATVRWDDGNESTVSTRLLDLEE